MLEVKATVTLNEIDLVGKEGSGKVALYVPGRGVSYVTRDELMVFAHDLDGLIKFIGNKEEEG